MIAGFVMPLADVDVTINNLSRSVSSDFDVLLADPEGQAAVIVSDRGANNTGRHDSCLSRFGSAQGVLSVACRLPMRDGRSVMISVEPDPD
jgi:hypothetical protein